MLQLCSKFRRDTAAERVYALEERVLGGAAFLHQLFHFCSSFWYFFRFRTKVALSMPRLAAAARTVPWRS